MHSNPRAGTVPGNFTEYNFWVTLSSVVPFLFSGRQAEQVRFPGDHFGRTAVPDVCLRRLYPGAFDMTPNICWTFPELYVLRRTVFQFLFTLGTPERTLPLHAHDWCPFMVWITLPWSRFQQLMQVALQTGIFCDFPPGHPRVHDESDEFFTFSKILTFIRSFSVIDFRTSVCKNFFSSSRSLYHIWPSFDTDYFGHVVYISRSQLLEQATFGLYDSKF